MLKEHLEALSVPISFGIGGCRRDDEQLAAEDAASASVASSRVSMRSACGPPCWG